jgi:hypothetical protein
MDSITEFLSNVFVDSKHRRKIEREIMEEIQEVPQKKLSITKGNVTKESQSAEIKEIKENVNSTIKESKDDYSEKRTKERGSDDSEISKESDSEHKSKESDSEHKSKESDSEHKSKESDSEHKSKESDSEHKSKESDSEHKSKESDSKSSKSTDTRSSTTVKPSVQKIILKAQEFYKRPFILMNDKYESHFDIVSDILHKLSNFKNVESLYDNTLNVITYNENKPYFKDLLLENPYLYFNNISIKTKLSKVDLKNFIEESDKRRILIVDLECFSDSSIISKFIDDSIHLIVLVSNYNDVLPVYNILGDNCLLINKKDKHKMIQRKLFQKVLKQITNNLSENEFVDILNDDDIDIQRLVIKNCELRYT